MPETTTTKALEFKAETDTDEGTFTAVINTGTKDRDSEVVLPKGGRFETFLKNPVVPFGHNYQAPPVAKALWIKEARGKIVMKARAAPTEMGQEVFELIRGGFLSAVSIGFEPLEDDFGPPTEKELQKHPEWAGARTIFRQWNLLEVSVVPVPANPEALITAVNKGLDLSDAMLEALDVEIPDEVIVQTPAVIKTATTVKARPWATVHLPGPLTDEYIARKAKEEIDLIRGRVI